MVNIEYIYTDCKIPKLTIAKDRVTFKFPKDYNIYLRMRVIALGRIIINDLHNENMLTLRGQFFLIDEKFVIYMRDNFRHVIKEYEEEPQVVIKNYKVPTGNICVMNGDNGLLEFLSIGDYGKDINLNQDKEVLDNTPILPLSEKWVITISTQYSCAMNCVFCDVPKVHHKGKLNLTCDDLKNQIIEGLKLHPEITSTKRLNVHFARMGEPTWNENVTQFTKNMRKELYPYIGRSLIHPVISTMMPKHNMHLIPFLNEWMEIKNYDFRGDAGLQLSINSTNDDERELMFSGNSLFLDEISRIGKEVLDYPKGRKITLNFAVADYEIDAKKLRSLFNPDRFIVKLTPMHKTITAIKNGIETIGDYTKPYAYKHHEQNLRDVGFEVLTFIASRDEDLGRITCGNAILAGTLPHKYELV